MTDLDAIYQLSKRPRMAPSQLQRKHKKKFDYGEFIAWDGEGITDHKTNRHDYMLLANSKGLRLRAPYLSDRNDTKHIPTYQIFTSFIESARANPHAIHVFYYGSYDFNKILRDLPEKVLQRIRNGLKAYWCQYSIEVRFGKSLWLKDRDLDISVKIWDVGSFFQQSFVRSLETWHTPIPTHILDKIKAEKQRRSQFTWEDVDEIEYYCCECELPALVLLMQQFRSALEACDLRISQWHGPGAIAGTLYKQYSIKRHKTVPNNDVNQAAQHAYGAGRICKIAYGHWLGPCHYYDIRSCYPSAIATLPSLSNANWQLSQSPDPPIKEFSLYRVSWSFDNNERFYPLRHRYSNGSVCYPRESVGNWIWTPEYELLCDYYKGQFEVEASYIFETSTPNTRPFTWVEDMYYTRQEWKRQGKGEERILKLGLNSLYGKMIQQLGWKSRDQLPAYHQLEWGGYVTSCARAQLFRAAYGNPGVIGFETDGILTTAPLSVRLSEDLGGWEVTHFLGCTYVQTGFYWLDAKDGPKSKYRGFDPGSVTREQVLNAWHNGQNEITAQLTRHIGLAYAMHTGHMEDWGNWITSPRTLDIGGASSKRIHLCDKENCRSYGQTLDQGLHDTLPYGQGTEFSAPYPLEWKQDLPEWKQEQRAFDDELIDYIGVAYS